MTRNQKFILARLQFKKPIIMSNNSVTIAMSYSKLMFLMCNFRKYHTYSFTKNFFTILVNKYDIFYNYRSKTSEF